MSWIAWMLCRLWWALWPLPREPKKREMTLARRARWILQRHLAMKEVPPPKGATGRSFFRAPSELGLKRAMKATKGHPVQKHLVRALARDLDQSIVEEARRAELAEQEEWAALQANVAREREKKQRELDEAYRQAAVEKAEIVAARAIPFQEIHRRSIEDQKLADLRAREEMIRKADEQPTTIVVQGEPKVLP